MQSLQARIEKHSTPEPNTGCVLWHGVTSPDGYGRIKISGRHQYVHRVAYELATGKPIPEEQDIDHLCRVRCCVNPAHMEPVSHRENCLRGTCGQVNAQRQRAKTHCPRGHEYAGANLWVEKDGHRHCRACVRIRNRAQYARRKEQSRATYVHQ